MADSNKDTIYIDIDDEITTIIDKLRASGGKVVALVLPKRAATLQSIVNMKLLKRAADDSKKNLVLITTESGLLPLAGAVGLHVAATPSSRPEIPAAPGAPDPAEEQVDETADMLNDDGTGEVPLDTKQSVGALAGASAMPLPSKPGDNGIETLELDNADEPLAPTAAAIAASKPPKPKKDKKLHIPNFERFRLLAVLGVLLLIILIVGGYFAIVVLPKATINIKTDASNVNTNVDLTLSQSAQSVHGTTIPAKLVSEQKTYTGTTNTTGQQNNGDKATGTVNLTLCTNSPGATSALPAGTGVSTGKQTYITQQNAAFQYTGNCSGGFKFVSNNVPIKAQNAGESYNTSGNTSFTVSGRSDISANGSASGGTDDIQQVVAQADIATATSKITAASDSGVQSELASQLKGQGLYAVTATYTAGTPANTSSNQVGDAASSVTVTQTITYTMYGANEQDIRTLVENDVKKQINTSQQGILSDGITAGGFKLGDVSATSASVNLQTVAEVGPSIDTTAIAKDVAGKKSGDIQASLKSNPDVTDVEVKFSPFWVSKAPSNSAKITVNVAKPTKTANAS